MDPEFAPGPEHTVVHQAALCVDNDENLHPRADANKSLARI